MQQSGSGAGGGGGGIITLKKTKCPEGNEPDEHWTVEDPVAYKNAHNREVGERGRDAEGQKSHSLKNLGVHHIEGPKGDARKHHKAAEEPYADRNVQQGGAQNAGRPCQVNFPAHQELPASRTPLLMAGLNY